MFKTVNLEIIKIVISIVVVVAILAAAWTLKGTTYENAWLYISCAWIIILPLIDLFFKKKRGQ